MKKRIIADFIKRNRIFLAILALAFIARIMLFFQFHEVWWDSGVYAGMGKYILSLGKAGLWEHIRPVLWPAALGIGWKSGFNVIIFGRIMELLLSLASIFLVYLISLKLFNKRTAIIASAMFAFSTIFFYLGFHIYTEIPALFLALMGVYLFIADRYYFSGLCFGLAFLAKFPAALFFIAAGLVLALRKDIRKGFFLGLGFITAVIPLFAAYQIFHGNFLLPLIDAKHTIVSVLGCNVLRYQPWHYYFYKIIADNPLNIFSAAGIYYFFRKYDSKRLIAGLCLALPLIYFSQLHCRDYRYLALFIPFVIMFSAWGIACMIRKKEYVMPVIFLVAAVSSVAAIGFYMEYETKEIGEATGYFRFLEGKTTSMEVWSSNPVVCAYSDLRINKIYYPVYNEGVSISFYNYLISNHDKIGYVLLDNCGGGIICAEEDTACKESTEAMMNFLDENFEKAYDMTRGRCYYKIYRNRVI